MPLIEVRNLSKTFDVTSKDPGLTGSLRSLVRRRVLRKHAVRDVSFTVDAGEIVGLVGSNGAGKTTIVKMLAGIVHPSGGRARVLGYEPWRRSDAFRRRIALVMGQKPALWWDLTAADCFLLLREIYDIPPADYRARLSELTEALGVSHELDVQVRRLSLGERMKLELVGMLLHAPDVVFLDEPTIGLDLAAQRAIREFLMRYRQERQPAVILTSHYMDDIEHLCDRLLILQAGELVYDGTLREVGQRFAAHKIVTLHLRPGQAPKVSRAELEPLGEVVEMGPQRIRIHVARATAAHAAARLVDLTEAVDLLVEEEEIGTIIEKITRARGGSS